MGKDLHSLELLERHHKFPGAYTFKVIAFHGPGLASELAAAVRGVVGREPRELSTRPSRSGRYLGVTLEVDVASAGEVLKIYEALKDVEGIVVLV